jgi:hypothetical protein
MKQTDLNFWHIPLGMLAAVVVLALLMCSCKSIEYVPVVEKHTVHDSIYFTQIQRDSIWQHDSILIKDRGDTVWVEKWHTKYVEKQVHDTTYIAKVDSIPVPYEVKVEVPAELSFVQKLCVYVGAFVIFIGMILLFWKIGLPLIRKFT